MTEYRTHSPFEQYARAGFQVDILPIIPPCAVVSPTAGPSIAANAGKIPGVFTNDGWVGMAKFTNHIATDKDVLRWSKWPRVGIGLQGRSYVGVDIDVTDAELADRIASFTTLELGGAPCRTGNPPKRLLMYRWKGEPGTKRRVTFKGPDGTEHAVEILGRGQQWVAEGTHPKTMQPYTWDTPPFALGPDGLAEVTVEEIDRYLDVLAKELETHEDYIDIQITGRMSTAVAVPLGLDDESLKCWSDDYMDKALEALPNAYSYDDWVRMAHAIKASYRDERRGLGAFVEWSMKYTGNTRERAEALWNSINSSSQGVRAVIHELRVARRAGRLEADIDVNEDNRRAFADAPPIDPMYLPEPDNEQETFYKETTELIHGMLALRGMTAGTYPHEAALRAKLFDLVKIDKIAPSDTPRLYLEVKGAMENEIYVERIKRFLNTSKYTLTDAQGIDNIYASDFTPPGGPRGASKVLMRSLTRQLADDLDFIPSPKRLVEQPDGRVAANTWRGLRTECRSGAPVDFDEVSIWLDHLEYLVPDRTQRWDLLRWFAWFVQHTDKRPTWHPVLKGAQGVGKDLLIQPFTRMPYADNASTVSSSQMMGDFNRWARWKHLVVVQETAGLSTRIYNRIKPYLTDPRITINDKGVPTYEVSNHAFFIFTTNYPDAIALDGDDRRLFVVDCAERPHKGGKDYYTALARWVGEPGNEMLLARYLLGIGLSGWTPTGEPPMSKGKREMIDSTRDGLETWLQDEISEAKRYPFNLPYVTPKAICESMSLDERRNLGTAGKPVSSRQISACLKRLNFERREVQARKKVPSRIASDIIYCLDKSPENEKLFHSRSKTSLHRLWDALQDLGRGHGTINRLNNEALTPDHRLAVIFRPGLIGNPDDWRSIRSGNRPDI